MPSNTVLRRHRAGHFRLNVAIAAAFSLLGACLADPSAVWAQATSTQSEIAPSGSASSPPPKSQQTPNAQTGNAPRSNTANGQTANTSRSGNGKSPATGRRSARGPYRYRWPYSAGRYGGVRARGYNGRLTPAPVLATPKPEPHKPGSFEVHGLAFERYRDDSSYRQPGSGDFRSSVTYLNVLPSFYITSSIGAYARFGGELVSPHGAGRDFNTNYYQETRNWGGAAAIDQWGLFYNNAARGQFVTVGRQDMALDAFGLIYDLSYRVGLHTFLDGISAVQKFGPNFNTDYSLHSGSVEVYAFSEDQYYRSSARNAIYAARGTYTMIPGLTGGFTLAHYTPSGQASSVGIAQTTNWDLDGRFQTGNTVLEAEYGKSSASTRNEVYGATVQYQITPLYTLSFIGYHIDQHADIGQDTTYVNNYYGDRYSITRKLGPQTSAIVYWEADHQCYGPGILHSFQITLQQSF